MKAIGVLIGSLGLFWTKSCVRENLDSFLLYLFCYVLILYLLARNAFIFVHLKFSGAKASYLLSKGVFLVIRTSGHRWASLRCVWLIKKLQTRLI
jgi:hypothetical protein